MLILVTGGCRSGKSGYAMERALASPGPWSFLATAQGFDDEMKARIAAHKRSRPAHWGLVEEPLKVPSALRALAATSATVVLDCVTLWMSNLIVADPGFDEQAAASRAEELAACARQADSRVFVITNEVGSGIVPDNELARRFRDCAGRANQVIARAAEEVVLLTSGIPLVLKGSKESNHDS